MPQMKPNIMDLVREKKCWCWYKAVCSDSPCESSCIFLILHVIIVRKKRKKEHDASLAIEITHKKSPCSSASYYTNLPAKGFSPSLLPNPYLASKRLLDRASNRLWVFDSMTNTAVNREIHNWILLQKQVMG
jgi:hypothetical protein